MLLHFYMAFVLRLFLFLPIMAVWTETENDIAGVASYYQVVNVWLGSSLVCGTRETFGNKLRSRCTRENRNTYADAPRNGEKNVREVSKWLRFWDFPVPAACAVIFCSLALGFLLSTGRINPEIEYVRTMQVTAHRGASVFYPENTMVAFEGARDMGAEWIELDVQQSRDGQIIVIHDTNFKRTTGVDAKIPGRWNMMKSPGWMPEAFSAGVLLGRRSHSFRR